jgi:hypothetical protein
MDKCEKCGKNKKRYRSAFNTSICDNCKAVYTKNNIFIDYDPENNIIVKNDLIFINRISGKTYPEITIRYILESSEFEAGTIINQWFRSLSLEKRKAIILEYLNKS